MFCFVDFVLLSLCAGAALWKKKKTPLSCLFKRLLVCFISGYFFVIANLAKKKYINNSPSLWATEKEASASEIACENIHSYFPFFLF